MEFDVRNGRSLDTNHTVWLAEFGGPACYVTYDGKKVAIEGAKERVYINVRDIDNCIAALRKVQELIKK